MALLSTPIHTLPPIFNVYFSVCQSWEHKDFCEASEQLSIEWRLLNIETPSYKMLQEETLLPPIHHSEEECI